MAQKVKLYLSIMVIYFVIDVLYQISFALKFARTQYANAGISDVMSTAPQFPWTIILFFVAIAYICLKLAVEPALEKKSTRLAFFNGALIGIAAYGTLALVFLWTIKSFPVTVAFEILLEGLLFPTLASGITAWWANRGA